MYVKEAYSLERYILYIFAEAVVGEEDFTHFDATDKKHSLLEVLGIKKVRVFGLRGMHSIYSKKCSYVDIHQAAFNAHKRIINYLEVFKERFESGGDGEIGKALKKVGRKLSEGQSEFGFSGLIGEENKPFMELEKGFSREDGNLLRRNLL